MSDAMNWRARLGSYNGDNVQAENDVREQLEEIASRSLPITEFLAGLANYLDLQAVKRMNAFFALPVETVTKEIAIAANAEAATFRQAIKLITGLIPEEKKELFNYARREPNG